TSGFVEATQNKGFEDISEIYATGHEIALNDYYTGYGAGNGSSLRDDAKVAPPDILFPELHYYTNDAWPIIRGVAGARGFPVLLNNRYAKGTIFVLNIPDNIGDLYALPHGVMNTVKTYLQKGAPVRLDSPNHVALFTYDNGAFIVESYRDEPVTVKVSLSGAGAKLADTQSGERLTPAASPAHADEYGTARDDPRTEFAVTIAPHSFRVFKRQ
ncbi:MAG: hypothetical protein ACXU8U_08525, partial [Asticcacaulis sp.]